MEVERTMLLFATKESGGGHETLTKGGGEKTG